jgi:hypothetical protein
MIAAQPAPPAGGAALDEIAIAAAIALAVVIPVAWFVWRELAGKPTVIGKAADWLAAKEGMPRWVSLPTYGLIAALLTAGWGVWWDVPIHMQNGRDEGPLANPSHYPIYLAILAIFALGVICATLAYKQPLPERALRVYGNWRIPMGAVIILGAGTIALLGFPADDVWHRLFGQDVTEWGPTHIMMIGGAVTAPLALPLLRAEAAAVGYRRQGLLGKISDTIMIGACIVPFAFLMEFDFGVPQFPAATQFTIAGFLAGWIFVTARRFFGPGGALIAWGFYAVAHGFLYLAILPLPGVLDGRFLLMLPAAVLVELVALAIKPKRGYVFGIVAGLLAGSLGMLAEWVWSGIFMPLPQPFPASSLPLLIGSATVAGLAGGLLGVWHYRQLEAIGGNPDDGVRYAGLAGLLRSLRLTALVGPGEKAFDVWRREMLERTGSPEPASAGFGRRHGLGLTGLLLFVALMAYFAPPGDKPGMSGTVELSKDCDGQTFGCFSTVTITLNPVDAADDAVWLYGLAWQGLRGHPEGTAPGDGVLSTRMLPTGTPGQFRSERPLPMYGQWKTAIRLHQEPTTMVLAQLYAPNDPAIVSERGRQVLVASGDEVPFSYEPQWLQRERKDGVPEWLWTGGYVAVGLAWAALIAIYGWAYGRAAGSARRPAETPAPRKPEPVR